MDFDEQNYFQLKTNVDAVIPFKYKKGQPCTFDLEMKNFHHHKVLYRMLTTDNKLFNFTPMTGFLAKDQQVTVKVTFSGKITNKKKLHYVCIRYIPHPPTIADPIFKGVEKSDPDDQWLALRRHPAGKGEAFYDEHCASRYFMVDLMEEGVDVKKDKLAAYLDDMKRLEQLQANINASK